MIGPLNENRRIFLKLSLHAGVSLMSLVASHRLCANEAIAEWPATEFDLESAGNIVTSMLQGKSAEETSLIQLVVPDACENKALVPVSFHTRIENLNSVTLLVDGLNPIAGNFKMSSFKCDRISTRVRVDRDTRVWAFAAVEDKLYVSNAEILLKKFQCAPKLED